MSRILELNIYKYLKPLDFLMILIISIGILFQSISLDNYQTTGSQVSNIGHKKNQNVSMIGPTQNPPLTTTSIPTTVGHLTQQTGSSTTTTTTPTTTTEAPTTTTTVYIAPSTTTTVQAPQTGVWDALAECETGGNWSHPPVSLGYSGGIMFHIDTWVAMGGTQYASQPYLASKAAQIAVAEKLLAETGNFSPWPGCRKKLGLS